MSENPMGLHSLLQGIALLFRFNKSYSIKENERNTCKNKKKAEFEVLIAVVVKSTVIWDVIL
jgi:hypothetical protein